MKRLFTITVCLALLTGCRTMHYTIPNENDTTMWKKEFNQLLPLLGHRNWILIVDQAYPLQSAEGTIVIDTKQPMKPVLGEVLREIEAAPHIKPILYTDLEFEYMDEDILPGVTEAKKDMQDMLGDLPVQTILHEAVFSKIDEASALFKTLILKTTSLVPYSSVFIELDCGYWSPEAEAKLRAKMQP